MKEGGSVRGERERAKMGATSRGAEELPQFTSMTTVFSYLLLYIMGHLRDMLRIVRGGKRAPEGYAALTADWEDFYSRRFYSRIQDCWNRPICSAPGARVDVMEREEEEHESGNKSFSMSGASRHCVNLGSYNYLGFAASDEYCTDRVIQCCDDYGASVCSTRCDGGTTKEHIVLEKLIADFVGKEAALVCGMGWATNSTAIPALVDKGCLVVSDALNHASIVAGVRIAGATTAIFRHNNPAHLERVLRTYIADGQPRTHRPWRKILIIVEGIYSMEGEICKLKEIVEIKKRYGAYLYLDEAHSIGACGPSGRGVCDHLGVDVADVDVMMGTFTKSFGSSGGYVAGSRDLIEHLRLTNPSHLYATAMPPAAVHQVTCALRVILGHDGSIRGADKLRQLRDNSDWFRDRLRKMGCHVLGDDGSPVMPLMIYNPSKIPAMSRMCFDRGVALVVVGFPATPLLLARARVCISASHSREDLEYCLQVIDEVTTKLDMKYSLAAQSQDDAFPQGNKTL